MDARSWVEQKFNAVKWTGSETIVRCPYHDDAHASLSVNVEKAVFFCHACGKKGKLRELGFEDGNGARAERPKAMIPILMADAKKSFVSAVDSDYTKKHYGELKKTHSYRLADSSRAFVVCRYERDEKKDIRPFFFGTDGRWHTGQAMEKDRPLYHLPELVGGMLPVLVVEGEKCADVPVPGFVLVTWAGGASAVSRTDWSPLKERDVTIWPDADSPGLKAAKEIKALLPQACILDIQGEPLSWDIADAQVEGLDLASFIADCPVVEEHQQAQAEEKFQGTALLMVEPEPWPDPVKGAELLQEVNDMLRRYVVVPAHEAMAVTVWTAFTWMHDSFMISPILSFTSPEKRCGKSTALSVLHRLVRRPLAAVNISPAALFRAVESFSPTLLVDEGDRFLKTDEENIGLLNSGHYRPLASVLRCVGEKQEVRAFSTWAPKAIGIIGALPGTLQDRSIIIQMQRKNAEEVCERLRADREEETFSILRRKLARWAQDHTEVLKDIDVDAPRELDDRAADNWRVLLAIAEVAGGDWPQRVREAALSLTADRDEQDAGTQLLADLVDIFKDEGQEVLPSARLLLRLCAIEERPWAEWRQGKAISAVGLARLLRRYKLKPRKYRTGEDTVRGYARAEVEAVAKRYTLPGLPSQEAEQTEHLEHPVKSPTNRQDFVAGTNMEAVPASGTENHVKTANVPPVPSVPLPGERGRRLEI